MDKLIILHIVQNRVFSYAKIEKEEIREFFKKVSVYVKVPITLRQIRLLETGTQNSVTLDDGSEIQLINY